MVILGAKRAYLQAPISEPTCVMPPHLIGTGRCWRMKKCMYGTLPAARDWQAEVKRVAELCGMRCSPGSPCGYYHEADDVTVAAHGDDFVLAGGRDEAIVIEKDIGKHVQLVRKYMLGDQPEDDKGAKVLNRLLTWSDDGILWEGDPRHAEAAIAELGLTSARPVTSPPVHGATNLDVD